MKLTSQLSRLQPRALLTGLALATTLATVGVQAQTAAQPATGAQAQTSRSDGRDPAVRQQRMAERHAQRMAELKSKLNISAAQEGAWNTWTSAMQPPTWAGKGPRMNRDELRNLSTPERLDRMLAMQQERTDKMRAHADATKTFYNALNAEQKKTFDEQSMRMGPRGGHRGGKGGGGPR